MLKTMQALIAHILKLFFIFGVCVGIGATAGCSAQKPLIVVQHVSVAPPDNLMVDCEITAPPSKETYLKDYSAGTVVPPLFTPDKDQYKVMTQYARALKNVEERESMLTATLLRQYQFTDMCNQRLKGLREWKAKVLSELDKVNKKE